MKRRMLGKVCLAVAGMAACGYAGLVLGSSQATLSGQSAAQPILGFDDSPDPDPAFRPVVGFDDSPQPGPTGVKTLPPADAALPSPAARAAACPAACPAPAGCGLVAGGPCGPCDEDFPRTWFAGEALLWWIRDSRFPPLVTTGPTSSLGVLGLPGTRVLFGGRVEDEERMGGRFRAGVWFDEDDSWGAETSFLFLGQRSVRFTAGSTGTPLLARPFLDALTGLEDADLVANPPLPFLPRLLPLAGRVTVTAPSRLWGLEATGVHRLGGDYTFGFDLLAGFRYLRLDEGLAVREDLAVPANAVEAAGTRFLLEDNFGTRNHFYGGELGTRASWEVGPWSLELLGKVGLGVTQQLADVRWSTQIGIPGLGARSFPGALLALPTNIGRHTTDRFGVLPEAGATVGYCIADGLRVTVGYSFLGWSSVARPGDVVNRVVNPTQLPPNSLRGPAEPAFAFHDSFFWAQGVNFGVEYDY